MDRPYISRHTALDFLVMCILGVLLGLLSIPYCVGVEDIPKIWMKYFGPTGVAFLSISLFDAGFIDDDLEIAGHLGFRQGAAVWILLCFGFCTAVGILKAILKLDKLLAGSFSRMRSEGFPFIVWGSGGWTRVRFVCCRASRRRASERVVARRSASSRGASLIPCHARRVCGVGGAVPWGLLLGRSRGWRCAVGICVSGASRVWRGCRCAMGIAPGRVAWVALCHGDCSWACRVGGAVPWGLLLGVSRGWRCAMGIAAGRVAWVPLCHGDCCWACRGCGAVPLSRGWRRVLRIADQGVVWVAPCLRDC